MKKSYWFVFIILIVLIFFLGILAVTTGINWVREKYQNETSSTSSLNNSSNTEGSKETQSAHKTYTANSGWSIDYPYNWIVEDDQNFVMFNDKEFKPSSENNGLMTITEISQTTIEKQKEEFAQDNKINKEEGIYAGSIYGTILDGEIKPGVPSKFEPGFKQTIALMPLNEETVLKFTLNDSGRRSIWLGMIYSLQTKKIDNSMAKTISKKSDDGNILIYSPTEGEKISSPYNLSGSARVFENVVNYELTDDSGNVLTSGIATALASDVGQFGDFSVSFSFTSTAKNGKLSIFSYSPKDGSKQDLIEIKVKF